MENKTNKNPKSWKDGDFEFTEVICQEYQNCKFSGGFVSGHPVDTIYLQAEKDGKVTTQLLLRPDEMAAIAWIASGVLWSVSMKQNEHDENKITVDPGSTKLFSWKRIVEQFIKPELNKIKGFDH